MAFRHSKIVCTIGPACSSPRMLARLLRAGMDVARLNFSHSTHEEHARNIAQLRAASRELKKTIAILGDLQGPKIRTGALAGTAPLLLRAGQKFVITTARVLGDSTRVSTTFRPLPREVRRGDRILLSDGLIELRVERVRGREVICEVVNGGELGEHKGINLPGVKLRVPAITRKDREDLAFALKQGADYIAASFVRRPEDVLLAKSLIRRAGHDTPVIAKLEKPEAIENLDAILRVADGVMVGRGNAFRGDRLGEISGRGRQHDGAHHRGSGSEHHGISAAIVTRTIESGGDGSGAGVPRIARAAHEVDRRIHAQRIYGAARVALPAAGAGHRVFAGSGNAAKNGADLGRHAEG